MRARLVGIGALAALWASLALPGGQPAPAAVLRGSLRAAPTGAEPGPPPPELVGAWGLSPFYRQHLDAGGLPILASERVSPYALKEARYLVDRMLAGREDLRAALVRGRVRVAVMAVTERTTAIPEHSDLRPARYWDRRARGLGATRVRPAVSCGEENLLGYPGDPYAGESILVHEFAHAIHQMALRAADPAFEGKLRAAFARAEALGRWRGTYAATNPAEYWAEGVQSWFDANQQRNPVHNGVRTREALEKHDPELAALIASVFPERSWRWSPAIERGRNGAGADHLAGYRPERAPHFRWEPELELWYRTYEARRRRFERLLAPPTQSPSGSG